MTTIKAKISPKNSKSSLKEAKTKFKVPTTRPVKSQSKQKCHRRSSMDFEQPFCQKPKVKSRPELVCTSCTQEDVNLAISLTTQYSQKPNSKTPGILTRQYNFKVAQTIGPQTTHVICGSDNKRTLNVLRGILRGCWILSKNWLYASLENNGWADEEPYELVDFSPAVKTLRFEREAFESAFKSELFSSVGSIYVSAQVKPTKSELQELIKLGGGTVANVLRVASIVIGRVNSKLDVVNVNEKWILDSIQYHSIMPFVDYQL